VGRPSAGAGGATVILPARRTLEGLQPGHRDRPFARLEAPPQARRGHRHQAADDAAEQERSHEPPPSARPVAHPSTSRWAMKPAIRMPIACTPTRTAPPVAIAITIATGGAVRVGV